ncbi:hypothetical protein ABTE36_22165, partial [Acinetobacter baumannii]
ASAVGEGVVGDGGAEPGVELALGRLAGGHALLPGLRITLAARTEIVVGEAAFLLQSMDELADGQHQLAGARQALQFFRFAAAGG